MKKLISVFVLAIMAVSMLFAVAGCSDNSALLAELEDLKDRVEDLENKNNVFWTDKAEYAEDETMTVWFKDQQIFNISIDSSDPFQAAGDRYINGRVIIENFVADVYADYVLGFSYIQWENDYGDSGTCVRKLYDSPSFVVCQKGQEVDCPLTFDATETLANGESFDFVICIPGTPFELAHFNITILRV